MKIALTILLSLCFGYVMGQSPIVTAEYFIDTDPGTGNGTPVSLSAATSVSINFDVELDGLEPGIHYLHIRVKNGDDKWSLYSRKPFHVTNFVPNQNIVAVEYFIDDDPGIGNGTSLPVTTGSDISETFAIPIDGIEPGIHYLHLRVKNSQDKWSHYARKLFYVMPEQVSYNIVAAEYFIDTDPGLGNGIPLAITPGQTISEVFEISTSDTLMNGTHLLFIRVLDDADKWSLYAVQDFVIDPNVGLEVRQIQFELFPNPTSDILFVKSTGDRISGIRVIDLNGKIVRQLDGINSTANQIDLNHLPAGTYLVQVVNNSGNGVSERIIKH